MNAVSLSGCCLSGDLRYSLLGNLPRWEAEEEVEVGQLRGSGGWRGSAEEGEGGEEGVQ